MNTHLLFKEFLRPAQFFAKGMLVSEKIYKIVYTGHCGSFGSLRLLGELELVATFDRRVIRAKGPRRRTDSCKTGGCRVVRTEWTSWRRQRGCHDERRRGNARSKDSPQEVSRLVVDGAPILVSNAAEEKGIGGGDVNLFRFNVIEDDFALGSGVVNLHGLARV